MKRARILIGRAIVGALLLVALNAGIASADPGTPVNDVVPTVSFPEDPGLGQIVFPEDPGLP
ncbi:MAG TPA: hypothetical protein VEP48_09400 [Methylomirabilota bacterium]|nr:hypothetical protein [Methylomirabilota bacterium]